MRRTPHETGPRPQILLALFGTGLLLFNFPLLALWTGDIFGLPLLPLALFVLWGLLIAALALASPGRPTPPPRSDPDRGPS